MRAFIYTGGAINPENITEHPKGDDLCIAADSGYDNAKRLGERVDIFVGDRDSYSGELPDGMECLFLKPEKDMTDTHAALAVAYERGADDIVIIGGLSGRLDHTMSNLAILRDAKERDCYAVIADGYNRVRYIRNDSLLIARTNYKYLSLIADDETVKGVEIRGVKYPLKNAKLTRDFQFAVSNEIEGNCALVAVKKGGLFVIESV
jgi:thiamine pyrophosphokinase